MAYKDKKTKAILINFNNGKVKNAFDELASLLKKYPNNLDYIFLYAKMCNQINKLTESEKALKFLISKDNTSIEYLHNLYSIYLKKKNIEEAETTIKTLLKNKSDHYESLRDLGYIEFLKNNFNSAQKILEKIINNKSRDVFALNLLGLVLLQKQNNKVAIELFSKAIKVNPNYLDSYNNLGKTFYDLENLDKAYSLFRKAYKINKTSYKTLLNIGNYLSLMDKNHFAIKAYKKAFNLNPEDNQIDANIAIAYARDRDIIKAKKYYQKAIIKKALNPSLDLSLAYLYLYEDLYEDAWKLFEARKQTNKFFKSSQTEQIINEIIKIKKENITNKKVLVLREQGIGEEILFSSMYKNLINLTNEIIIEADDRLVNIFERSFNKKIFVSDGLYSNNINTLKKFDTVIFAGSLCKFFRKNKSDFPKKAYLFDDIKKSMYTKKNPIFNNKKIKVGLSWKSVVSVYGKLKSLNLLDFKSIFNNNREIINLQYGNINEEIAKAQKENLNIFTFENIDLFNDLDQLMSILKNLDVFVTVSNSTAHLAASMGVKTILICPKKSSTYFYWSNKNNKTPWYKDVTILKIKYSIENTINEIDKILNNL